MPQHSIPTFSATVSHTHDRCSFECPSCGKENIHHRVTGGYVQSDCECWPDGYYLETREPPHYTKNTDNQGFERIPIFEARVSRYNNKKSCMVFNCPKCGKKNIHSNKSGHHTSDCGCWKNGYYLKKKKGTKKGGD